MLARVLTLRFGGRCARWIVHVSYFRDTRGLRRRVLMEEWGRYLARGPKACASTGVMLEAVAAS